MIFFTKIELVARPVHNEFSLSSFHKSWQHSSRIFCIKMLSGVVGIPLIQEFLPIGVEVVELPSLDMVLPSFF